jgi:hypothetical protein
MGFQPMRAILKVNKSFQLRNPSLPLAAFGCFPMRRENKGALRFQLGFRGWHDSRGFSVVCMGWKPMSQTLLRCASLPSRATSVCMDMKFALDQSSSLLCGNVTPLIPFGVGGITAS